MLDFIFWPVEAYFSKILQLKGFKFVVKHVDNLVDQCFYVPKMEQFISTKCKEAKEMLTKDVIELSILTYILLVALVMDWMCIPFLIVLGFLIYIFSGRHQMTFEENLLFSLIVVALDATAFSYLDNDCWMLLNLYFFSYAETYYKGKDLIETEIRAVIRLSSIFFHFALLCHVINFKNDGFNDDYFMFMVFVSMYFMNKYSTDKFNTQHLMSWPLILYWASEGYDWDSVFYMFAMFLIYRRYAKSYNELKVSGAGNWSFMNDEWMLKIVVVITFFNSLFQIDTYDLILDFSNVATVSFNDEVYRRFIRWIFGRSNEEEDVLNLRRRQRRNNRGNGRRNNAEERNNELPEVSEQRSLLEMLFGSEFLINTVVFYLTMTKVAYGELKLTKNEMIPITLISGLVYLIYEEFNSNHRGVIGSIWTGLKNKTGIPDKIKTMPEYQRICQQVDLEIQDYQNMSFVERNVRPIGKYAFTILFLVHFSVYRLIVAFYFSYWLPVLFIALWIMIQIGDNSKESVKESKVNAAFRKYLLKAILLWTCNFVLHLFKSILIGACKLVVFLLKSILLCIWRITGLSYIYGSIKNRITLAYHKIYCMHRFGRLRWLPLKRNRVVALSRGQEIHLTSLGNLLLYDLRCNRQITLTPLGDLLLYDLEHTEFESISIGESLVHKLEYEKDFEQFPFLNVLFNFLLLQRRENFGDFEVPNLKTPHPVRELYNVPFPAKYAYLLKHKKLDEDVLKTMPIWETLMGKPTQLNDVMDKSSAILSLEWAQKRLYSKRPIFRNVILNFVQFDEIGDDVKVTLELFVGDYDPADNQEKSARIIREGDLLDFKFPKASKLLGIGEYKVDEFCDNTIILSRMVRDPTENKKTQFEETLGLCNWNVDVYFANIEFIPRSMNRSFERIQEGKLNNLVAPVFNFETKYKAFNEKFEVLQNSIQTYTGLNMEQSKALYSICTTSHGSQPYVLWGLSGTGKSRTIISTVRAILKMHPDTRVLITAPSNAGADMLAFRLLKAFPRPLVESLGVLRLYSINSEVGDLNPKLRSISCINPETDMFEIPEFEELVTKRVIISTLGTVTHLINKGVPPGFFSHIFVDDAGQATEPEFSIPIGGLATNKTSLILFGDHKQLGPTYYLNLLYKTTKEFGSPLLRYMQNYNYRWDPRVSGKLTQNYRCHSKLLSIVTQYTDGHEENNQSVKLASNDSFTNWKCLKQRDFPFLFVSVHGREVYEPTMKSYANHTEIEVVLRYITEILKVGGTNKSDIGIICSYRHQINEMSKRITEIDEERKITINTIKGFQSSERKVIILSAVRTHGIGFLDCELQLNSAITRAKDLLIIVGYKENLSKRPGPYKDFISYCQTNKLIVDWNGDVFIRKSVI